MAIASRPLLREKIISWGILIIRLTFKGKSWIIPAVLRYSDHCIWESAAAGLKFDFRIHYKSLVLLRRTLDSKATQFFSTEIKDLTFFSFPRWHTNMHHQISLEQVDFLCLQKKSKDLTQNWKQQPNDPAAFLLPTKYPTVIFQNFQCIFPSRPVTS